MSDEEIAKEVLLPEEQAVKETKETPNTLEPKAMENYRFKV